jgi:hypothetical protein
VLCDGLTYSEWFSLVPRSVDASSGGIGHTTSDRQSAEDKREKKRIKKEEKERKKKKLRVQEEEADKTSASSSVAAPNSSSSNSTKNALFSTQATTATELTRKQIKRAATDSADQSAAPQPANATMNGTSPILRTPKEENEKHGKDDDRDKDKDKKRKKRNHQEDEKAGSAPAPSEINGDDVTAKARDAEEPQPAAKKNKLDKKVSPRRSPIGNRLLSVALVHHIADRCAHFNRH